MINKVPNTCTCDLLPKHPAFINGTKVILKERLSNGSEFKFDKIYQVDGVRRNFISECNNINCADCFKPVRYFTHIMFHEFDYRRYEKL